VFVASRKSQSQIAIDDVGSVQNTRQNVSDIACDLQLIYVLTR